MKVCTACHYLKDEFEFHKNKNSKDGHCNQCKVCVNGGKDKQIFDLKERVAQLELALSGTKGELQRILHILNKI